MDLNLYLGLPRSPMRRGSDLGSDLALGSLPMLSEEICTSAETSVFRPPLDSHAPYSPTHASYSPSHEPVDHLDLPEVEIPHFDYSPYNPQMSRALVSSFSSDETNSNSHLEYFGYAPNYISAMLVAQPMNAETSHPDSSEPLGHAPYSPSYLPISATERESSELGVEGGTEHAEYVPSSPSYIPLLTSAPQQPNEGIAPEIVDPYVPSSPLYAPASTVGQDGNQTVIEVHANVLSSPSYSPVTMPMPEQLSEGLIPEEIDPYVPSSPSYASFIPTALGHDDHSAGENSHPAGALGQSSAILQISERLAVLEGSSQRGQPHSPAFRLRRLIDSSLRSRVRRFRSEAPYRVDPDIGGASSLGMEDHSFPEVMAVERPVQPSEGHKVGAENLAAQETEEELKEQSSGAANFECNICLDMAREPVVTSCGHLFCWPCLYQWLHLHSDHKECPVCKGEVTESNITPIYGRGSSEAGSEKTGGEEGDSSLKVPPRPRGHRFESLRQQIRRPFSRRLGHEIRSWHIDEEARNASQVDGPELPGIFGGSRRVFSRLRAQRLRREGSSENGLNIGSSGMSRNTTDTASNSQIGNSHNDGRNSVSRSSSIFPEGIDIWHRLALFGLPSTERIAALTAGLSNAMERMASIGSHSSAAASANPQNSEPLQDQGTRGATPGADQASASSTMAVIQGDVGVIDTSAEANVAGSSRSLRRRRRNGASTSLDVDGGGHHAHKRRRLN